MPPPEESMKVLVTQPSVFEVTLDHLTFHTDTGTHHRSGLDQGTIRPPLAYSKRLVLSCLSYPSSLSFFLSLSSSFPSFLSLFHFPFSFLGTGSYYVALAVETSLTSNSQRSTGLCLLDAGVKGEYAMPSPSVFDRLSYRVSSGD